MAPAMVLPSLRSLDESGWELCEAALIQEAHGDNKVQGLGPERAISGKIGL